MEVNTKGETSRLRAAFRMNIKLHPRTRTETIQRRSEANLSRLDFVLYRCYRFGIMFPVSIGDAMFIADGLTEEGTDVSGH